MKLSERIRAQSTWSNKLPISKWAEEAEALESENEVLKEKSESADRLMQAIKDSLRTGGK